MEKYQQQVYRAVRGMGVSATNALDAARAATGAALALNVERDAAFRRQELADTLQEYLHMRSLWAPGTCGFNARAMWKQSSSWVRRFTRRV